MFIGALFKVKGAFSLCKTGHFTYVKRGSLGVLEKVKAVSATEYRDVKNLYCARCQNYLSMTMGPQHPTAVSKLPNLQRFLTPALNNTEKYVMGLQI